jgi:hypothetical protein
MAEFTCQITHSGKLLIGATTSGKGRPRWELTADVAEWAGSLLQELEEHYDAGLYSTGPVGEVRDMTFAMARVAQGRGWKLQIPAATRAQVDKEAAADASDLPEGAVH